VPVGVLDSPAEASSVQLTSAAAHAARHTFGGHRDVGILFPTAETLGPLA